jgi:hypothetical protein
MFRKYTISFVISVRLSTSAFGFLHGIVDKCSDVSKERTATIFRVTEMVHKDDEVIRRRNFVGVWPITAKEDDKRDIFVTLLLSGNLNTD